MLLAENNNKCKECGNYMNSENKKFCFHYSCSNCGYETIEWNIVGCCNDPILRPKKYFASQEDYSIDPNDYKVYQQCHNCGKKAGTALKKSDYHEIEIFDKNLEKNGEIERTELRILSKEIENRRRNRSNDNFELEYAEYRKSDRWQKIRKIILERDNFLCQSCLVSNASEIHHKDGVFRMNEPLFSLVSVCSDCHRIITEIEQTRIAKDKSKIKYKFDKE